MEQWYPFPTGEDDRTILAMTQPAPKKCPIDRLLPLAIRLQQGFQVVHHQQPPLLGQRLNHRQHQRFIRQFFIHRLPQLLQ
jgi:hypothetical protein